MRTPDLHSQRETERTRRRYDRNAPLYNLMESLNERRAFSRWRQRLWSMVDGGDVLEVGVGTGKNIPYYPHAARITAIDLSPRMLSRARELALSLGASVDLREMDAQHLVFPDESFDTVVATFVFCSVPDPVAGLGEIRRVLRPGGRLLLLEHVLSNRRVLGRAMNVVNPVVVRLMGANINRQTERNLEKAGFRVEQAQPLWADIFWLFVART